MMRLTTAVKHLLIINLLLFVATIIFQSSLRIDLENILGLHYVGAADFRPWQFITYMFMHANVTHILCNMFAVYMFGTLIEQALGTNRFVVYYLACGVGAAVIQQISCYVNAAPFIAAIDTLMSNLNTDTIQTFLETRGHAFSQESALLLNKFINDYNGLIGTDPARALSVARTFLADYQQAYLNAQITVGASGSVFGILLAVGMLFPNLRVMLLFPPIPLKAKWFVLIYGAIELFAGVADFQFDNVAHWAHLGGMVFGFILLKAWRIERFN